MYFIEIEKGLVDSKILKLDLNGASSESCKKRRRDRVWDPEGSSWVEDPQYFETIAWPYYLKTAEKVKSSMFDVKFLDSTRTSIEHNLGLVLQDIIDRTKP